MGAARRQRREGTLGKFWVIGESPLFPCPIEKTVASAAEADLAASAMRDQCGRAGNVRVLDDQGRAVGAARLARLIRSERVGEPRDRRGAALRWTQFEMLSWLIAMTRHYRHVPSLVEIDDYRSGRPDCPSRSTFLARLGSPAEQRAALLQAGRDQPGAGDLQALLALDDEPDALLANRPCGTGRQTAQ